MDSSTAQVSLLTARGMSAIASVALTGDGAGQILSKVFQSPVGQIPEESAVACGSIVDGDRLVDEVVIAVEAAGRFVIHCHGNPLLAEQIIKLLQHHGAALVSCQEALFDQYKGQSAHIIEAEAQLAMQKSATLTGVKILSAQIQTGLSQWARDLSGQIDTLDMDEVKSQCRHILQRSEIAARIINGVKIVLAGPPNSGKSTLLNAFAGDRQVIVSDTAGTTRDWVSITCHLGPIHAEFIDTAGLDKALARTDDIEQAAQQITQDLLDTCDLILYIQDISSGKRQQAAGRKPVIEVFNKCDLIQERKNTGTQELKAVCISAKESIGIDTLTEAILHTLQVDDFPFTEPIVFTSRQHGILNNLLECDDKSFFKAILGRFFN